MTVYDLISILRINQRGLIYIHFRDAPKFGKRYVKTISLYTAVDSIEVEMLSKEITNCDFNDGRFKEIRLPNSSGLHRQIILSFFENEDITV